MSSLEKRIASGNELNQRGAVDVCGECVDVSAPACQGWMRRAGASDCLLIIKAVKWLCWTLTDWDRSAGEGERRQRQRALLMNSLTAQCHVEAASWTLCLPSMNQCDIRLWQPITRSSPEILHIQSRSKGALKQLSAVRHYEYSNNCAASFLICKQIQLNWVNSSSVH